jgi:hypothetical protein
MFGRTKDEGKYGGKGGVLKAGSDGDGMILSGELFVAMCACRSDSLRVLSMSRQTCAETPRDWPRVRHLCLGSMSLISLFYISAPAFPFPIILPFPSSPRHPLPAWPLSEITAPRHRKCRRPVS